MAILIGSWVLTGCGSDSNPLDDFLREPDPGPIRSAVQTAVPVAYIASVSMASVRGFPPPNATATHTCTDYPCTSLVFIELDDPTLPFGLGDAGSVMVAGLWSSNRQAILTATFLDVYFGSTAFQVTKISTFPVVEPLSGGLKAVYADIDINISTEPDDAIALSDPEIRAEYDRLDTVVPADPQVSLGMDAWVVEVDDGGTPQVLIDDRYIISGGGQYLRAGSSASGGSAHAMQLAMAQTIVSWDCPHNPIDGLAAMQELGVGESLPVVASALIVFDAACDGNAKITLATGNYIATIGSSMPLDLSAP